MDGCLLSRLWITQRPISVQAANKNPMPPMVKTSSRQTPSLLSAARLSLLLFWELQIINLQVSVPEVFNQPRHVYRPVETSARLCGAVVTGRYSPLVAVGDAGSGIASATIPAQTCITATVEPA